jgi:hypothetical protein
MCLSHTFVPSPGTTPKADDFCIQSPTTFRMLTHQKSLTFHLLFCLYLSSIRQASDALGHVHVTLRHPLLSHGWVLMGGFVRGHLSISLPPLSSPTLPLFICILPTPLYHLQGPHPKANNLCIQSPTTFRMSTHQKSTTSHSFLHSYLNDIGRTLDALG